MKSQTKAITHKQKFFKGRDAFMYLLLLPSLIIVLIFAYMPLAGLIIAFKDYDALVGIAGSPWVGLDNFREIFSQPNFINAIKNTLFYSSVCLFGKFPFPIILALLLNEIRSSKLKRTVQTISYLPHFLSWISVTGIIYTLFSIDGPYNAFISWIMGGSYEKTNILMESKNFLGILFGSGLWKEIGWSTIIFLAAITGIDPSLYEAASIDGVNKFQQAIYITLPAIKTTAVLILIMNLGNLMNSNFEQIYSLQNPYIQNETEVISTLIYRQGIQSGEYSAATAFGIMQSVVSLVLVIASNKFSKIVADVSLW